MILRRACPEDAGAIARVHRQTMRKSLDFLPELHTETEDFVFMQNTFLPANEVWVAEVDGEVVGYIGFHPGWIDHLYIAPDHQGCGLGPALLDKALSDGGARRLWTFQQNLRARAFYEKRGFRPKTFTDGAGNEEKTPMSFMSARLGMAFYRACNLAPLQA
ncbi:MAG: GNAT family N-acetyltransferase [Phenylobacterium zucineum]|nr:MAG: GNAT family N-acetyltransferase [Phenylobacterium zucineum]